MAEQGPRHPPSLGSPSFGGTSPSLASPSSGGTSPSLTAPSFGPPCYRGDRMLIRSRAVVFGALALAAACSPKQMALNRMASAMSEATSVYDTDNDPEFVRLA